MSELGWSVGLIIIVIVLVKFLQFIYVHKRYLSDRFITVLLRTFT